LLTGKPHGRRKALRSAAPKKTQLATATGHSIGGDPNRKWNFAESEPLASRRFW
jgi:hypothetical protein